MTGKSSVTRVGRGPVVVSLFFSLAGMTGFSHGRTERGDYSLTPSWLTGGGRGYVCCRNGLFGNYRVKRFRGLRSPTRTVL